MTLAHRMIVMNQGIPEQIGTPIEVFEQPASTFVASFIGSPPMNLIPVSVSNEGVLQTDDGIALDLAPHQIPAAVRQRPVIVGMRPEHMMLRTPGITGEVEMIETLGSEQLVHCRCGPHAVVVRCATRQLAETPVKLHEHISLGPDTRYPLHWFDGETGRRIACD